MKLKSVYKSTAYKSKACSVFMFLSTLLDSEQKRPERDAKFEMAEDFNK